MKSLYLFSAQGIEGRFIADADAVANIIGKTLVLEEDDWHDYRLTHTLCGADFQILSVDPDYLRAVEAHGLLHGFNPFLAETYDEN